MLARTISTGLLIESLSILFGSLCMFFSNQIKPPNVEQVLSIPETLPFPVPPSSAVYAILFISSLLKFRPSISFNALVIETASAALAPTPELHSRFPVRVIFIESCPLPILNCSSNESIWF